MLLVSRFNWLVVLLLVSFACDSAPIQRATDPVMPVAGAFAPVPLAPPEPVGVVPNLLSETGLFFDVVSQTLAPGVEEYSPLYGLWSDGADKRRWIKLPPGTRIETSDMDVWGFPVGTKIWKEFGRNGKAIETRYMVKHGPGGADWTFLAYQWNDRGNDAFAVPNGVSDAGGTTHDIPSASACVACHNGRPVTALGFSALQLSHDGPGLTLGGLGASGRLSVPPANRLRLPGDAIAERALGYLHANCGSCHNGSAPPASGASARIVFWQAAAQLATVEQTATYVNMVANTNGDLRSLRSGLERMRARPLRQMPPLSTELVDADGAALVDAWLQQLSARFPAPLPASPNTP